MNYKMKNIGKLFLVFALISTFEVGAIKQITTTKHSNWEKVSVVETQDKTAKYNINIDTKQKRQKIDGFGGCFNELGWTSLSLLSEKDKELVMSELFKPNTGANFNICRMPVGANDFSIDWYSYNETEGDFEMKNFSITNDKKTLIPFIKSAQSFNPKVKIWASPWCPPSWMKHNKHYAAAFSGNWVKPQYRNGLEAEKAGKEGTDMFIQKPEYLQAYALYFSKFIDAYKKEKINIFAVMPQNEFNSAQIFPSCCWTAASLGNFIGNYLGPAMAKQNVSIMFGTMERPNVALVDTILNDPKCSKYVKGVGFQWAGKDAVGKVYSTHPNLKLYQSEQECGDGKNDWKGVEHSWDLLKHYFDNGVSAYMYWNISLLKGGISRWGWAQNSLVVVDPETKTYTFTAEYYLMKHISHFVKPGAFYIKTTGLSECLAFQNPDKSIVVLTMEKEGIAKTIKINNGKKSYTVSILPNSINTFVL